MGLKDKLSRLPAMPGGRARAKPEAEEGTTEHVHEHEAPGSLPHDPETGEPVTLSHSSALGLARQKHMANWLSCQVRSSS